MMEEQYVEDPYGYQVAGQVLPIEHPPPEQITPEYVLSLTQASDYFLCPNSANVYQVDFIGFRIRNLDDGQVLFEVAKAPEDIGIFDQDGDDAGRSIAYNFGPHFLDIQTVGTELTFNIGPYPMQRFRMIERHYFRDMIIKSFDFEMPFAMPNSTNTWEVMYSMPELSPELREAMMTCPWEAKSDTFYFVDDKLIMQNRAEYNYAAEG
jgi:hypothetical protein